MFSTKQVTDIYFKMQLYVSSIFYIKIENIPLLQMAFKQFLPLWGLMMGLAEIYILKRDCYIEY